LGHVGGGAALTATIRGCAVTQLGFSGIMLPVVEDATLAQRALNGCYTLRDLFGV
jgi:uncharacterized protein (UPF0210 family)